MNELLYVAQDMHGLLFVYKGFTFGRLHWIIIINVDLGVSCQKSTKPSDMGKLYQTSWNMNSTSK